MYLATINPPSKTLRLCSGSVLVSCYRSCPPGHNIQTLSLVPYHSLPGQVLFSHEWAEQTKRTVTPRPAGACAEMTGFQGEIASFAHDLAAESKTTWCNLQEITPDYAQV